MNNSGESDESSLREEDKRPPLTAKKKVTIQIDAISTPKGNVPTVDSLERVVNGLNILDSEISLATDEARKDVLVRIKDLEKELMGVRKLISEMAISFEAVTEKLSGVDPKLQKTLDMVESQRMESAELARYIGAVTNNLRREFIDYINLLEKKLSEKMRKDSKSDFPELKEYLTKLNGLQDSSDKKIGESILVGSETKKTVEGLREDLSDLVKFLGDTLAGFSHKLDDLSNKIPRSSKSVEALREQVEKSRKAMDSKIHSSQGDAPEDSEEDQVR
jgi:uncharacterized phage infection (PIP) family protein YhgE